MKFNAWAWSFDPEDPGVKVWSFVTTVVSGQDEFEDIFMGWKFYNNRLRQIASYGHPKDWEKSTAMIFGDPPLTYKHMRKILKSLFEYDGTTKDL